jgi:signal transduction histidine kinase
MTGDDSGRHRRHWHRHHRHHHHRHHHGPRRLRGPAAYLRARLRRRIFAWFGVSILVTGLVSSAILWVVTAPAGSWRAEIDNLRTFTGHRFADVWDDPAARERLTASMVEDLKLDVVVRDASGATLHQRGDACDDGYDVPVVRAGEHLGTVAVCLGRHREANPRHGLLWVLVAGAVLWAASGAIAMRLTRPLMRLVDMTRRIGDGELDLAEGMRGFGHSEFRVIGQAVADMAERIQQQLTDQRELLAAVSHELRTPLGHLRVLTELARDAGAEPSWVADIEQELLAIDTMVDQLLASSRVDFGNLEARPLDAVQLGLRALERAGVDPTCLDADAETVDVEADAALVLQALANLLRNAAEHAGGVQALEIRHTDDEVTWTVVDAGPGFGGDHAQAFDAFARGGTRKPRAGSLGLGLALVRRIAQAHGGDAEAKDVPGGGARVSLTVPRRAP